jgi:hypothetical protein
MNEMPDELRDIDKKLRAVRFRSAPSLKPELLGRLPRGEPSQGRPFSSTRRHLAMAAAALLMAVTALSFAGFIPVPGSAAITVDRCCYDLDGGGPADDGVLVLAQRDSKVYRLRIYEDLDASGSYTMGDLVRLDRGEKPVIRASRGEGIVTIERCCIDFDGGGPSDDGLLVIGVPPNRVLMAAIYETGAKAQRRSTGEGWLLR